MEILNGNSHPRKFAGDSPDFDDSSVVFLIRFQKVWKYQNVILRSSDHRAKTVDGAAEKSMTIVTEAVFDHSLGGVP
jgi:hypothetical protein